MPLVLGDVGYLDEQPLSSGVLETRFGNPQLHGATRVNENLRQLGFPTCTNLPIDAFAEVEETRWMTIRTTLRVNLAGQRLTPYSEPPRLVSQAVSRGVERERLDQIWIRGVSDEATRRMRVKTEHEEESEVVGVPECLKALGANFMVGRGVPECRWWVNIDAWTERSPVNSHQDHDEQKHVSCDASRLGVVNLQGDLRPNLTLLHGDEVHVVRGRVDHPGFKTHQELSVQ